MKRVIVALTVGLIACSGDSAGPQGVSLEGNWVFSFSRGGSDIPAPPHVCRGDSLDFAITQRDATFTGVQVGSGRLRCEGQGGVSVLDVTIAGATIVDGSIEESDMSFRINGPPSAVVTGSINPNESHLEGTAEWQVVIGGVTYRVVGSLSGDKT